jgi:hypothetical protein
VVLDVGFARDGAHEVTVDADIVHRAGVPDVSHFIGGQDVGQEYDVVFVRMAKDDVIDNPEGGVGRAEVRDQAVVAAAATIVVAPPS